MLAFPVVSFPIVSRSILPLTQPPRICIILPLYFSRKQTSKRYLARFFSERRRRNRKKASEVKGSRFSRPTNRAACYHGLSRSNRNLSKASARVYLRLAPGRLIVEQQASARFNDPISVILRGLARQAGCW